MPTNDKPLSVLVRRILDEQESGPVVSRTPEERPLHREEPAVRPAPAEPQAKPSPERPKESLVSGASRILQVAAGVFMGLSLVKLIPIPPLPHQDTPKPPRFEENRAPEPPVEPAAPAALSSPAPAETEIIPLKTQWPRGLSVASSKILVVDRRIGKIAALDARSYAPAGEKDFPNSSVESLSADRRGLWSGDPDRGKLFLHHPQTYAVLAEFKITGEFPSVVHSDGTFVWSAARGSGTIARRAINSKTLGSPKEFRTARKEIRGISKREEQLFVLESSPPLLVRYEIGSILKKTGEAALTDHLPPGSQIEAMDVGGGFLWVLTDNPPLLHKIDSERLSWK